MLRRTLRHIRSVVPVAGGAAIALIVTAGYLELQPPPGDVSEADVRRLADQRIASATPAPALVPLIYAAIRPSVVVIEGGRAEGMNSFSGRGSGVVVDENGSILTSNHVVAGVSSVTVRFFDGSAAVGRVVQTQPERDLAIVRVQRLPNGVRPATLGGGVAAGQEVLAIGSPFGLDGSVSSGVVSGLNRRFTVGRTGQVLEGMIQFDAAVNPGNSGGPLVDMRGNVVGIVAGIANPTDQSFFIGLGFAVPIEATSGILPPVG